MIVRPFCVREVGSKTVYAYLLSMRWVSAGHSPPTSTQKHLLYVRRSESSLSLSITSMLFPTSPILFLLLSFNLENDSPTEHAQIYANKPSLIKSCLIFFLIIPQNLFACVGIKPNVNPSMTSLCHYIKATRKRQNIE